MAVACVPIVSQWAEMQRMALGRGSDWATSPHARLNSLSSIAFIGLPCPRNRAGIVAPEFGDLLKLAGQVTYRHWFAFRWGVPLIRLQ